MLTSCFTVINILLVRGIRSFRFVCRELFFQGIDEIEEEAERVEAAKVSRLVSCRQVAVETYLDPCCGHMDGIPCGT
jgi:hypothetical protein